MIEIRDAQTETPNSIVIFGKPKAGKSTIFAKLSCETNSVIIDLEHGYKMLRGRVLECNNIEDIKKFVDETRKENKEKGGFVYKYIVLDNMSRLQELTDLLANDLYRKSPMGSKWGYLKKDIGGGMSVTTKEIDPNASVKDLANGTGYNWTRKAMNMVLSMFTNLAECIIYVGHTKDKQINQDGQDITELSLDMDGKSGNILCGSVDAVGFCYRKGNNTIISFKGGEGTICESRSKKLSGKEFIVSTKKDGKLEIDLSMF